MIQPTAATGFARGAEDYEVGRPSYPSAAVDVIIREFSLAPGRTVVDVGAGTGKFTRLLVPSGARIVGVEPVAEMREVFARAVPDVEIVDGTAEALPFDDESVDLVTAAQSFHWVDAEPAVRELFRVVRRGGGAAFIWNTRDIEIDWVRAIKELMDELATDTPRYGTAYDRWQDVLREHGGFSPLQQAEFRHDHPTTRSATIARVASTSYVSALDDEARMRVLERVAGIIEPLGDSFVEPYITDLKWCHKA